MEHVSTISAEQLESSWTSERGAIVALCVRMIGNADIAEDLAQETLLEAWRHRENLRAPERVSQWLFGIARHVCLRWVRQQQRHASHIVLHEDLSGAEVPTAWEEQLATATDVEVELERRELAGLLDRALGLLPAETRAALLAHHVEETPLAEIAARLGTNVNAVAMRLQRGKLALRRILTDELRQEFGPYEPAAARSGVWEETRLWCTACGRHRLLGRYHSGRGELWLRCPACYPDPNQLHIHADLPTILGGVKGYQRAHSRLGAWVDRYYRPHLRAHVVPCVQCGRPAPLRKDRPSYLPPSPQGNDLGLRHLCDICGRDHWESLDGLLLATPQGRAFLRRHPRIRTLPSDEVEAQGRLALVTRFDSVASQDHLVMVSDAETFELLAVDGRSV